MTLRQPQGRSLSVGTGLQRPVATKVTN
jgi:hypothetical protein